MTEQRFEVRFDEEGHLVLEGREGWREPVCPICGEPIRWVLDMASFTSGLSEPRFTLAHARCVWIRDAFVEEGKRAPAEHGAS